MQQQAQAALAEAGRLMQEAQRREQEAMLAQQKAQEELQRAQQEVIAQANNAKMLKVRLVDTTLHIFAI